MYKHGGNVYQHKDKIDFSANINLLGMPEKVVRAACEGVMNSGQYPDPDCLELRTEISRVTKTPKEHIICGNGAADLIFALVLALKPARALIPIPTFYEYEQALKTVGCEIEYVTMKEEQGFKLQEDFLARIKKGIDIIFLCNPNNPTGNILDKAFVKKVIQQCERNKIWLIVDECFMDFIEDSSNYSVMDYCSQITHLFILKAFTKLYAMPGLRLGYGICNNAELLNKMKQVLQPWNVSIPAQKAGIAALQEQQYVKDSMEIIKKERQYLIRELQKLKFKIYGSRANYIFFYAHKGLYENCLEKGILIRDCSNYPGLKVGFYRIAVKRHEDNEYLINVLREEMN